MLPLSPAAIRRIAATLLLTLAAAVPAAAAPADAARAPSTSPRPVITPPTPGRSWKRIAYDSFTNGTQKWSAELESGGSVQAAAGTLDIDIPGGATVWLKQPLRGPYVLQFTAVPVAEGGANDHVTDLNTFWNARDVRSPTDIFATARSGAFADYDLLRTYYVGYGANLNTTTRFRRYVGELGNRPLLGDLTGPLLSPNTPERVKIVSTGSRVQYWRNGTLLFDYTDPEPYAGGWFAFRTVASHFRISDFAVWRLPAHSSRS